MPRMPPLCQTGVTKMKVEVMMMMMLVFVVISGLIMILMMQDLWMEREDFPRGDERSITSRFGFFSVNFERCSSLERI